MLHIFLSYFPSLNSMDKLPLYVILVLSCTFIPFKSYHTWLRSGQTVVTSLGDIVYGKEVL
jgi:hypothetical protein